MPSQTIDRWLDGQTRAALRGVRLTPRGLATGGHSGTHRGAGRGSAVEFAEHRPYVPGDDLRRLDWAVLARQDRHHVRQYEAQRSAVTHLVVDASASMAFAGVERSSPGEAKFDHARRVAAAIAHLVLRDGDAVSIAVDDHVTPMRCGQAHLPTLLAALSAASPKGADDGLAAAGSHAAGAIVVLISDFLGEPAGLAATLHRLSRHRNETLLLQILHPEEMDLPRITAARFHDPEATGRAVAVDVASARQAYQERLHRHIEQVAAAAIRVGGEHLLLRTDQPVGPALRDWLARRDRPW